ncbi:hypothetical protein SDC9_100974 [bioreactor metagenome]|uniref:PucR C-terminal helix-turn-helix domain-containing protein n=1 Tax=bioreactor metagenome TaxID=1076179 RepID=A0A645AM61_9ZZZZ
MPAALSERTLLGDILLYLIETQNMNSLNDSLLVDFLTKERQEMNIAVERVESIGFSALSSYQIAIVGKRAQPEDGEELSETYKYAYKIIRERVFGESGRLLYMHWKNLLVMAIELSSPEQTPEAFKQILEAACANARFLCPDIGIRAAMGRVCSPLTIIKRSFDEALFAFNIYDLIERENHSSVVSFDDIGFYRVLRGSHNVNEFRRFYEETTGKIAAYDKENNTEFVKSLELYMENDCDLDKASALLFIHKNTLRYRLLRIESITGKSLKNMRVLADYYTCFKIKAYLGLIDR